MILRINQIDAQLAEQYADWPAQGLSSGIRFDWPADMTALELLVLEKDKGHLSIRARQLQLRQLIPRVVTAFLKEHERLVVRLDGPVGRGELPAAADYLLDSQGRGRFAISAVQKLEENGPPPVASLRIQLPEARLQKLCADREVGLERSVRLRAFAVPAELANPLLDIEALDDERWPQILSQAGFVLSTGRQMQALYLFIRGLSPQEAEAVLSKRLKRGSRSRP